MQESSRSSGNVLPGAGGLRFKSWIGQIGHKATGRTVTFGCGRLGAIRLCTADYSPGLLGVNDKKIFPKIKFYRKKFFSKKKTLLQAKKFFIPKK